MCTLWSEKSIYMNSDTLSKKSFNYSTRSALPTVSIRGVQISTNFLTELLHKDISPLQNTTLELPINYIQITVP